MTPAAAYHAKGTTKVLRGATTLSAQNCGGNAKTGPVEEGGGGLRVSTFREGGGG